MRECLGSISGFEDSSSWCGNRKGQVTVAAVGWARSPEHSSPYGDYLPLAKFGNFGFDFVMITGENSCRYSVSFLVNISPFLSLIFSSLQLPLLVFPFRKDHCDCLIFLTVLGNVLLPSSKCNRPISALNKHDLFIQKTDSRISLILYSNAIFQKIIVLNVPNIVLKITHSNYYTNVLKGNFGKNVDNMGVCKSERKALVVQPALAVGSL